MKLGKLEINLDELSFFLAEAKKSCYAGNGKEEIMPDGSKRLVFQKGNFWYEDNYDGYYQAPGRELVRWKREDGQRIWQMAYSGGMSPFLFIDEKIVDEKVTKETFDFLKRLLSLVTSKMPFRGPLSYSEGETVYSNQVKGDIKRFSGKEKIMHFPFNKPSNKTILFSQDYIGCLVIPK